MNLDEVISYATGIIAAVGVIISIKRLYGALLWFYKSKNEPIVGFSDKAGYCPKSSQAMSLKKTSLKPRTKILDSLMVLQRRIFLNWRTNVSFFSIITPLVIIATFLLTTTSTKQNVPDTINSANAALFMKIYSDSISKMNARLSACAIIIDSMDDFNNKLHPGRLYEKIPAPQPISGHDN
jgi:hypothetical protein